MKRSLRVMGQTEDAPPAEPQAVRVGEKAVVVQDEGDGSEAQRLAAWMIEAGARAESPNRVGDALRIVIRTHGEASGGAHDPSGRASPDFVLASARRAFAQRLVESIAQGAP